MLAVPAFFENLCYSRKVIQIVTKQKHRSTPLASQLPPVPAVAARSPRYMVLSPRTNEGETREAGAEEGGKIHSNERKEQPKVDKVKVLLEFSFKSTVSKLFF